MKSNTIGAYLMLFVFSTFIIIAWYDYFTTPQARIAPFFTWIFMIGFAFYVYFGEWLGFVMKKKNFHTEGGLTGVYSHHIDHDSGMSTYYFTTYRRYLDYVGYTDYQEKNIFNRFIVMFSNVRFASITDKSYLFEHIKENISDTPEGCIVYRGSLRKGTKINVPEERWKIAYANLYDTVSELATITEKARAVSESAAQSQSKDLVETAIKFGAAIDNLGKALKEKNTDFNQRER